MTIQSKTSTKRITWLQPQFISIVNVFIKIIPGYLAWAFACENALCRKKGKIMIGLITIIILFNFFAFKTNKRLTFNQVLHIWTFTIAFQVLFDLYIDFKYHGYWYFTKEVDWASLPVYTVLIPPVNIIFLNWYPFTSPLLRKILYFIPWIIFMLIYEIIANLPEPWGYFHYGWWNLWYSAIIDPILLLILLGFYKIICKAEKKLILG